MKTTTPPPTLEEIWQRTLGDALIQSGASPEKFRAIKSAWLSGIRAFHETMITFGDGQSDKATVLYGVGLINEANQLIQQMNFRKDMDN